MGIEEFAQCYADRVGTTVDAVREDVSRLGAETIQAFLAWWRGLSEADRALVTLLASIANGVLLKILTRSVGAVAGGALIALLGGASWALLVRSFLDCESRL